MVTSVKWLAVCKRRGLAKDPQHTHTQVFKQANAQREGATNLSPETWLDVYPDSGDPRQEMTVIPERQSLSG